MVALSGAVESLLLNGLLCVILLVATASNSLLLFVFYRRPGLRTVSNRFVINLLVTNLITCWILLPSMLADNVWRRTWSAENAAVAAAAAAGHSRGGGDGGGGGGGGGDEQPTQHAQTAQPEARSALPCLLLEGAAVGLCVACVLSVVMIGVDQYFAVIDPLRYHASIKTATSALMILVSWTIAAAFAVLGAFSADANCAWYACERARATWPLRLPDLYRPLFAGLFVAFAFVAPFGAICWIYLSICSAARQNHKRTTRHGSAASCGLGPANGQEAALLEYAYAQRASTAVREYVEFDDADDSSPRRTPQLSIRCPTPGPGPGLGPCGDERATKPLHHSSTKGSLKSTSSSIVNSLRHRISNASMFRYREETRAARISALVIVMALFCWLPFTLVLVARTPLLLAHLDLPHYVKQMGILSLSSNAVVSPLIFAHRNRRIHRELCRLFRVSRRRASFYGGDGGGGGGGGGGDGNVKRATRSSRDASGGGGGGGRGNRRTPFRDALVAAAAAATGASLAESERTAAVDRSDDDASPPDAGAAAAVAVATAAAVTAATTATATATVVDGCDRRASGLSVDRRVSILNRLWRASRYAECGDRGRRRAFRLPEVAFETDTSRSSFSSNASTGSHHRSTSLASVSDAAADDY